MESIPTIQAQNDVLARTRLCLEIGDHFSPFHVDSALDDVYFLSDAAYSHMALKYSVVSL